MTDPEYRAIRDACSLPAVPLPDRSCSRRNFLKGALAGAGGILLAPWLEHLEAFAAPPIGPNDGILVCIQLGGGLDGLHTLVPYPDPEYLRLRGPLALSAANVLPIDPGFGLHPRLATIKALYDQGKVAIVRGVGFGTQDGSHFTSMATWMQGWAGAPGGARGTGWLGRFLDGLPNATTEPLRGVTFGTSVPLHLLGANATVTALPMYPSGFFGTDRSRTSDNRAYAALGALSGGGLGTLADDYAASMRNAIALPSTLTSAYTGLTAGWGLERECQLAAKLINANIGVRVICCELESFDHHSDLLRGHDYLLGRLDRAISDLLAMIEPAYRNRVTVLTFSEFGRRPAANGSEGVDHGTASIQMLLGDRVRGGLYGQQPSLAGFGQESNPVASLDFRRIYGEVAQTWLRADPTMINGLNPTPLGLFRGGPTP